MAQDYPGVRGAAAQAGYRAVSSALDPAAAPRLPTHPAPPQLNVAPTLTEVAGYLRSALKGAEQALADLEGFAQSLTGAAVPRAEPDRTSASSGGTLPDLHAMAQQFQNVIGQIGVLTAHLHRAHG